MRKAIRNMRISLDVVEALTFSTVCCTRPFLWSNVIELSRPKTVESCDIAGVAGGDKKAMTASYCRIVLRGMLTLLRVCCLPVMARSYAPEPSSGEPGPEVPCSGEPPRWDAPPHQTDEPTESVDRVVAADLRPCVYRL